MTGWTGTCGGRYQAAMFLEKYDLSGRTAVVTGGGRGIGLACGHALAEAGAAVIIADVDPAVAAVGQANLAAAALGAALRAILA